MFSLGSDKKLARLQAARLNVFSVNLVSILRPANWLQCDDEPIFLAFRVLDFSSSRESIPHALKVM